MFACAYEHVHVLVCIVYVCVFACAYEHVHVLVCICLHVCACMCVQQTFGFGLYVSTAGTSRLKFSTLHPTKKTNHIFTVTIAILLYSNCTYALYVCNKQNTYMDT